MPSSIGYSSLYAGDMHIMPSSTRHPVTTPRGYSTSTTANGVPTTTRTYAVTRDPRAGPGVAREQSRTRRSTLDSAPRPPVIVTTTQADRQQGSHHHPNHSPVRNQPRASDSHLYAQPASSIRSRSTAPPYHHRHHESDDYSRGRERDRTDASLAARDAEAYRSSRPSVLYPSDPRHSTATVDYGDEGYQYTNAGELARYDLDHSKPSRTRRRESVDRGYYRPNVNYNTDQRSFNVNTSADLSRNYTMNTSRPYEGPSRGGPPPSTRGFDRIDRTFDSARDVPPSAPVPPSPTISRQSESTGGSSDYRVGRRGRPVSLYQDAAPRSSHHDDYYRSREDERNMREIRDRERESERAHDVPYFHDESITSRGFGIRTGPINDYDDRRDRHQESWRDEPRKRSDEDVMRDSELDRERRRHGGRVDDKEEPRKRPDEDLPRESDPDRERRRRRPEDKDEPRRRSDEDLPRESDQDRERRRRRPDDKDGPRRRSDEDLLQEPDPDRERRRRLGRLDDEEEPRERREGRRESDEDRSHFRDKLASGVGIAAAAIGLAPTSKDDDGNRDRSDREPRRRRSPTKDRDPREEADVDRPRADERDRYADHPKDQDHERDWYDTRDEAERSERHRREAEEKLGGEAVASGSDSDGGNRTSRKSRPSIAFNPNDASDISKLKEQLAAMDTSEKEKEPAPREPSSREQPAIVEPQPSPPKSPIRDHRGSDEERDESRGRELALVNPEKSVRVVSPPRDKREEKPLKGILKQPRASFPEEESYIREGVAPHKEDKKAKEVPAGARWTRISRKVVNPEALTVGKERFEVRDDFVIVLRVLSKEEIQAYAAATQVLRGKISHNSHSRISGGG